MVNGGRRSLSPAAGAHAAPSRDKVVDECSAVKTSIPGEYPVGPVGYGLAPFVG
jgi:hypothetical protein